MSAKGEKLQESVENGSSAPRLVRFYDVSNHRMRLIFSSELEMLNRNIASILYFMSLLGSVDNSLLRNLKIKA